jgi:FkbM family methyltransferase
MGFKLAASKVMQGGEFEPEETAIVQRLLGEIDVLINVGANVGYYCCIALSQGKEVVAFEPVGANLRCLRRNLRANGWERGTEIHAAAVTGHVGTVSIYGSGTGASTVQDWAGIPERYVTTVPSTTLDAALGERFAGRRCLVIIDVEGGEQPVLEGGMSIVRMAPKPVWMVEICTTEHQPRGIPLNPNLRSTFSVFWNQGYEAWTADEACRIVSPEEIDEIMRSARDSLQTHNFLFIEKGRKRKILGP